jgi:hypothetical protein
VSFVIQLPLTFSTPRRRYRFPIKSAILAVVLLVVGVVMTIVGVENGQLCTYAVVFADRCTTRAFCFFVCVLVCVCVRAL